MDERKIVKKNTMLRVSLSQNLSPKNQFAIIKIIQYENWPLPKCLPY